MSAASVIAQISTSRDRSSLPSPSDIKAAKQEAIESGDMGLVMKIESEMQAAVERIIADEKAKEAATRTTPTAEETKFPAGKAVDDYLAREDVARNTQYIDDVKNNKPIDHKESIERLTSLTSPEAQKERRDLTANLIAETKNLESKKVKRELSQEDQKRLDDNHKNSGTLLGHHITAEITLNRQEKMSKNVEKFDKDDIASINGGFREIDKRLTDVFRDDKSKALIANQMQMNLSKEIIAIGDNPMARLKKAQPKALSENPVKEKKEDLKEASPETPKAQVNNMIKGFDSQALKPASNITPNNKPAQATGRGA